MTKNKKGFTLIELLIVIAIITILAAAIVVGINPARHFRDARNATRWSQMSTLATAIFSFAVENGGAFPDPAVPSPDVGDIPCIGATGTPVDIGTDPTKWCYDAGTSPKNLLVPDYIHALPTPPLPGETYQIQFLDDTKEAIKITSSETEASAVVLIQ